MSKQNSIENILNEDSKQRILTAIHSAEKNTSGEIRVHLENFLPQKQTAYNRAVEVFSQLDMQKTRDRNGMLIYIAYQDHQFAILGDQGINEKVGQNFWDEEKNELMGYFKEDRLVDGLIHFIAQAGVKLQKYFPYQKDDLNELSDDISLGND